MKTKRCPKCGAEHGLEATYCGCGHKWVNEMLSTVQDPHHHLCAYMANGHRCHYPGTVSENTTGGGPFYCSHHAAILHDTGSAAFGAEIVEASRRAHPSPGWWTPGFQRQASVEGASDAAESWLDSKGLEPMPYESKRDHALRLREHAREMGPGFKRVSA
jgi:hypothetical protein